MIFQRRLYLSKAAKGLLLLLFINLNTGVTESTKLCDPNDYTSCGYGGDCVRVENYERFFYLMMSGYRLTDYVCVCNLRCYSKPEEVLCSHDTGRSYYNEWCVLHHECLRQAPIRITCENHCSQPCKPRLFYNYVRCELGTRNPCNSDEICMQHQSDSYDVYCKK